jgi:hypothetical protein
MLGVTVNGDAPKATVHPPAALRLFKLQARRRERGGSSSLANSAVDARWHPPARVPHASLSLPCCTPFGVGSRSRPYGRPRERAALAARSITRVGYPRA